MKGLFLRPAFFTPAILIACAIGAHAQQPVVASGGVLNAASNAKGVSVSPGSLVSIYGTALASTLANAGTIPLSTTLGNVTVTFNNIPAPLLYVGTTPQQINAQLPWELQGSSSAQVVVSNGGTASAPMAVTLTPAAPGIFSVGSGVGQAIAYGNSDGQLAAAAGAIPGLNTHPAKIGDPTTLVILATGLGPVNPPVQTGNDVTDNQTHPCVTPPVVMVGGVAAQVVFAGMTPQFVGVYQINIVIQPGTPTGNAIPLQIQMNGITTTNQVTIAVSN
jgi:minor extracellular serine protease Vpr